MKLIAHKSHFYWGHWKKTLRQEHLYIFLDLRRRHNFAAINPAAVKNQRVTVFAQHNAKK